MQSASSSRLTFKVEIMNFAEDLLFVNQNLSGKCLRLSRISKYPKSSINGELIPYQCRLIIGVNLNLINSPSADKSLISRARGKYLAPERMSSMSMHIAALSLVLSSPCRAALLPVRRRKRLNNRNFCFGGERARMKLLSDCRKTPRRSDVILKTAFRCLETSLRRERVLLLAETFIFVSPCFVAPDRLFFRREASS